MNPNAKEFVPAHIQKKRQEEAEQVDGLASHLDRTDLNGKTRENGEASTTTTTTTTNNDNNQKLGGDRTSQVREKQDAQARSPAESTTTSSSNTENKTENSSSTNQNAASNSNDNPNSSNRTRNDHEDCNGGNAKENNPGQEDDDRYLLRAGENICEFNGEQFIIPGDEYENDEEEFARHSAAQEGYDFGNAEDNEDEDICNAYNQFLENLPE